MEVWHEVRVRREAIEVAEGKRGVLKWVCSREKGEEGGMGGLGGGGKDKREGVEGLRGGGGCRWSWLVSAG